MKISLLKKIRLLFYRIVKEQSFGINQYASEKLHELTALKNQSKEDVEAQTKSLGCFMDDPTDLAEMTIDDKYSDLVKVYFMLKQALAVFEAESQDFNLQVFNEMRNALDHLMRSQIFFEGDTDAESKHIKKAEDHVQRAFLDISKILCVMYRDNVEKRNSGYSEETISHVDSGNYQKKFTRLQEHAYGRFSLAKASDYKINDIGSDVVRNLYIKAIIAHKKLHEFQLKNFHKFKWANYKVKSIKGLKFTTAIIASLIAGVLLSENIHAKQLLDWLSLSN